MSTMRTGVKALSAGGFLQSCALMKFGGVYCWGNNDYGQLGTGDTTERLVPSLVAGFVEGNLRSCCVAAALICGAYN